MSIRIDREKVKIFVVSILVPVALGALVGVLTAGAMNYDALEKPPLAPPPVLFPIAWTVLYVLMGVSYGILKAHDLEGDTASTLYYFQLIVNLLWPIIFFVLQWRLFAFIWILLLDALVIGTAVSFYRRKKIAGLLQIPYAAWVLFASYLNLALYLLNR